MHPVELSTRIIDSGIVDTPPNRVTQELSELADGVTLIESFSHVVVVDTGDGLVAFDSSGAHTGPAVVAAFRGAGRTRRCTRWCTRMVMPITSAVRGRSPRMPSPAGGRRRGCSATSTVGARFDRYEYTAGYNRASTCASSGERRWLRRPHRDTPFLPSGTLRPDVTYETQLTERIGDVDFEFRHCLGETDDHTWTWLPDRKMISAGDQFIWNFPNCGNPQKVQRYPLEWADSLRAMAAMDAELFVPAHGLPIAGAARIRTCLETVRVDTGDIGRCTRGRR